MQYFLALFLLGLVQGLTEFLPVSSSGHLVLLSKVFGIEESLFISILLHVATLFSIVVVFYKDIWNIIRHPFSKDSLLLVVATIPTCIIVLIFMPLVKQSFMGSFLPMSFAITALLLYVCESLSKRKQIKQFSYKTAILMGIAQGFAVFPGISRSGATIGSGLLSGAEKGNIAKFSFLMSIPIIILSLLMEIYEIIVSDVMLNFQFFPLLFSFMTSFIVGIFAIKLMLKITTKAKLHWFSLYLVFISIISLFIV